MRGKLAASVLVYAFVFLFGAWHANAATLTVTKTADTNDGTCNSDCSLREAIAAAASTGDVLVFASPLFDAPQTITLSGTHLENSKTLTINGRGANLTTISGATLSRIFRNTGNLTITGLALVNGDPKSDPLGGAIYSLGSLTVDRCSFGNNKAEFYYPGTGSDGWGGAIYLGQFASLSITNSSILNNSAYDGGSGIFTYDDTTLYMANTTVAGNSGGGGSGLYISGSSSIYNSTIVDNSAILFSTGGILYIRSNNRLVNTIVSRNSQMGASNIAYGPFASYSGTNNLIDSPDPGLAERNFYGGTMPSYSLLYGSPALNTGSDCVLSANSCGGSHPALVTDLRGSGFPRKTGSSVDIGALEGAIPFVSNANSSGNGSLSKALTDAVPGDTVVFDSVFFSQPRTINSSISLNKSINIAGPGPQLLTLDATNSYRAVHIDGGATVTLSGIRIYRGMAFGSDAGGGALVSVNSTLNATNIIIEGSSAPNSSGGAIYNLGLVNLTNSTIFNNYARAGGGIFNDGTLYLINSTISGNQATADKGAGIYNAAGRFTLMLNSTITNNYAWTAAGAGIWNENFANPSTWLRSRNSIISGNISGAGNPIDYVGGITDLGNNLINNTNPGLAPLANYGGSTPTHALMAGSPAIDSGDNCALILNSCGIGHPVLGTDQRGMNAPRKIGSNVDIGAYERNIAIVQSSLPGGMVSVAYNQSLTVDRSTSLVEIASTNPLLVPFSWSIIPVAGQSLPPGLTLSSVGVISGTPSSQGTFTFTVKATDIDSMAGAQVLSITVVSFNTPPTINGATISRVAGSPISSSTIATVNDAQNGPGGVTVTVPGTNPLNGVTVSNIVNSSGNVTANVIAGCSATNAAFSLAASDGTTTTNGTMTVNVTANPAPTLTYPAPPAIVIGNSTTVTPTAASDNGAVTYSIFSVTPSLTTPPTVNSSGVVSIVNAQPLGDHVITVRSTDNCGLTRDASFTLRVRTQARLVTKVTDSNDGVCDSDCSLREAIAAAEPGDPIEFASPLFDTPQTILLTSQLSISGVGLVVTGRGAHLTAISGQNTTRVFNVNFGSELTLEGLTIRNGRHNTSGGGINMDNSNVTLNNCAIINNTVRGSSSKQGGGISNNDGILRIRNSTIAGNVVTSSSYSNNYGGGIASIGGALNITNSTISGNSLNLGPTQLGGGLYTNQGDVTIHNSTIVFNTITNGVDVAGTGGGFASGGDGINMVNSIISGNSAEGDPNISGSMNSSQQNYTGGDAKLAPLGDYGGTTQTHAPMPNSPVINAGNNCILTAESCLFGNAVLSTDQRGSGTLRRIGTNVDIGAIERSVTLDQPSVPNGATGAAYSQQLSATRSSTIFESFRVEYPSLLAPNTFEIVPVAGQSLPAGITLASSGLLSGMPTFGGTYVFTVKAIDTDGIAGVAEYTMNVFGPTAANVTVSGRVLTNAGLGLRNAIVTLSDADGSVRNVGSSSFGYYSFDNVFAGRTYVLSVSSKRYAFTPRVLNVTEELSNIDLVADGSSELRR